MLDSFFSSIGYANFILVLGVLIFVHELGHYLAARWCGIRVETFSIGFGPELFGRTDRYGTRWKISAIPLGGYVKMFGAMLPVAQADDPKDNNDNHEAFHTRPLWSRAIVIAAGPAANFFYAIIILWIGFVMSGRLEPADFTQAGIGTVVEGSPAEQAGLETGDRIIAIDGQAIDTFEALRQTVSTSGGRTLAFTVIRDGQDLRFQVTPEAVHHAADHSHWRLGVHAPRPIANKLQPLEAASAATRETISITWATLRAIGEIITGARSHEELGGPVRIAQLSNDFARSGFMALLFFTVVLSINLGLLNLLPIPVLDGGYLVFCLYEAVRGKPPGEQVQAWAMRFGLAIVGTLIVVVTFNDIVNLFF